MRDDGHPVRLGGGKQRAVLALLLLNANRVVARERMIEQLWGELPPATAATALHGHISSLRKVLGPDVIATRPPGYVLETAIGELDLERFEWLLAEGRDALERGDPDRAAERLRAALELWRGEALSDIAFEPFVRTEAARLEDLRLDAVQDRIEADLTTGHGTELVGELERLVAAEPLRERFWAQLMLALYRSGRQADALDAYRRARQTLVSQLGIEPGPELRDLERRILAHDPTLGRGPRMPVPLRRTAKARVALALMALAAIGVIVAALLLFDGSSGGTAVPADSVAIIDLRRNAVVGAISVLQDPGPIAAGAGLVWAVNLDSETVSRIDPQSRELLGTKGVGEVPGNIASAGGEVWVLDRCLGGEPGSLLHIHTAGGGGIDLDEAISLADLTPGPGTGVGLQTASRCGLAAAGRSAWVTTNVPPGLVRVDFDRASATSSVGTAIPLAHPPSAVAVGADSVWAIDAEQDVVRRIDPVRGEAVRTIRAGNGPVAIAVGEGAVWVANGDDDSVSRIDPRTNAVTKAISVGEQPAAVATGGGSVWVANSGDGSVSRIDPQINDVVDTFSVGHSPQGVAVAGGTAWVTVRR
ncbi:MAG TPA: BTAD domain-containing putative transcriptional regulator [Microbacterium sp.]|nr:BTAD domain-containing putative transcriptional regulator [Microbacterium sp.]